MERGSSKERYDSNLGMGTAIYVIPQDVNVRINPERSLMQARSAYRNTRSLRGKSDRISESRSAVRSNRSFSKGCANRGAYVYLLA